MSTIRQGELSNKQQLFVSEYKKDANGARAAAAAGYKNPGIAAAKLTDPEQNPLVVEAIHRMQAAKSERAGVTAQELVKELCKIAFFNPKRMFKADCEELLSIHDLPDEVAVCVKEFKVHHRLEYNEDGEEVKVRTVEVKFHDKMDALKQLAGHLGLLKDIVNITNNNVILDWAALLKASGPRPVNDPVEAKIKALPHREQ